MLPFHFRFGPFGISPVELFAALGVALVGILIRRRLSPRLDWGTLLDLGLAALLGGAVGARLFYFLPLLLRGQESVGKLFSDWSQGSGFYGGLILGMAAVWGVARWKKVPQGELLDAIGLYLPLGFAVGKVGCFLAGCCYGRPWPWGLRFSSGSLCHSTQVRSGALPARAGASLPVHPAQLYEMALGIGLFGLLWVFQRTGAKRPGEVFLAYVAGYSVWRFAIEFLRDDPGRHGFGTGLSDSQVTALVAGLAAVGAWAWIRFRKPAVPAPETPK